MRKRPAVKDHRIGQHIASLRGCPRMTIGQFSAKCGVSRSAIYRVVWGSKSVSPRLLEKIEAATHNQISAIELFAAWKTARDGHRAATA